jgi:hypothetical protein
MREHHPPATKQFHRFAVMREPHPPAAKQYHIVATVLDQESLIFIASFFFSKTNHIEVPIKTHK